MSARTAVTSFASSFFIKGSLLGFWIPSIFMGLGIAIDVTLATLSQYRDRTLSFWTWTFPITCTHVTFPAVGYFLFWKLAESYPAFYPILGLSGFLLVALFVYEVICESAGIKPIFGISASVGALFGFSTEDTRRYIKILAVSWDAAWSGFAKEAMAEVSSWTPQEVVTSFLIAGFTVTLVAQLALYVAKHMRSMDFSDAKQLTRFSIRGKFVELSVIGGFGVLALLQGISSIAQLAWIDNVLHLKNIYVSIGIMGLILLPVFTRLQFRLVLNGHRGSIESVEDNN